MTATRDTLRTNALLIDGKRQVPQYVVGCTLTTERLGVVRIVKVHPMGTVDVVTEAGRYYRVSGLPC